MGGAMGNVLTDWTLEPTVIAGLAIAAAVISFFAWPLTVLALIVFWITRYPIIRQGRSAQP